MRIACLFVALAACGGSSGSSADAPAGHGDSAIDSPLAIDAPGQPVTVAITAGGVGRSGVQVIVTKPDLSDGGSATTDATGSVQLVIAANSSITAVDPFVEDGTNLYTVTDAQPGDHIAIAEQLGSGARTSMAVTLPTFPTATSYFVYTACGTGTPGDVELVGCGATTPLLAVAFASSGNPLASFYLDHATVGTTLDLHASTFAAVTQHSFAFTNVPASTQLGAAAVVIAPEGIVYSNSAAATPSNGSAAFQLGEPTAIGAATIVIDASYVASGGTLHHTLGASTTIDFGTPLPEMSAATATSTTVNWTATTTATAASGANGAIATVHRTDGDVFRHVVGPFDVVLDTTDDVFGLPPVAGFDFTGTWDLLRLEAAKAGGGEQALREHGLAGDYAFALDGTTSLVTEFKD